MKNNNYDASIEDAISMVNAKHLSEINIRNNRGKKPYMPPDLRKEQQAKRTQNKYISNKRLRNKKRIKLPKALSLLLAAGILSGSIAAITLGYDHITSINRDNDLAQSQKNLADMANRETAIEEIETYEQGDNSLKILNSDLNNLIQKYKKNPNSVTNEEVRNLLAACYKEGRDVVFSKIAKAYNEYSQENDEFPKTIDAEHLIYRVSDGKDNMTPCYIAYRPDSVNNPNGTALPSNDELSNFISTQLRIKELYSNEPLSDVSKSLNLLKEGITGINVFYTSDFNIEKGLFGERKLVIEEKEKNNALINYDEVEDSLYSYTGDKDTGDR